MRGVVGRERGVENGGERDEERVRRKRGGGKEGRREGERGKGGGQKKIKKTAQGQ